MSNLNDSALNAGGRFGRRSYLAWNLLMGFCLTFIFILAAVLLPGTNPFLTPDGSLPMLTLVVLGLIYVAAIYFSIIFLIRRLHDRNHSGWLSLLVLVPIANLLLVLYVLFAPGNRDNNQFGQPRSTRGWENVLAIIYIVLILLSIVVAAFALPSYQNYVDRMQQTSLKQ
ncbi:DUF805 domain-containing protein [Acinetobacter sp. LoGeW2-3]|uniref:DUF805 domain-containing protein n=1 Tax=Acinetobacter sp. LoGeW2-3 TaxID=1808001 RepID=UPI000C058FFC|nr:DUF805 domain-containing protein [Acinetobacter sp. LoGeW2-3]ATO18933.1 DUF805 domain-containing protein [Acinetobacter sp. LoGeW2-3]